MRTRTYLIFWTALAISVVLVVVLAGCTSAGDQDSVIETSVARGIETALASTVEPTATNTPTPTLVPAATPTPEPQNLVEGLTNEQLRSPEFKACMQFLLYGHKHFFIDDDTIDPDSLGPATWDYDWDQTTQIKVAPTPTKPLTNWVLKESITGTLTPP